MDSQNSLARIDSFVYQHKVADLMSRPVISVPSDTLLHDAMRLMDERNIGAVLVIDPDAPQQVLGIITERDVTRIVARKGGLALGEPVTVVMSQPVVTVRDSQYLHVAVGRMQRLRLRHLVVVDGMGRPLGMVSARSLIKQRASSAFILGDAVDAAHSADDLKGIVDKLPGLAESLVAESVPPRDIAAVISAVMRDLTAKAAALAEAEMRQGPQGAPPARYAVMVLGSGGRGESLLAPDQDNAIIHAGSAADDPWFAAMATRMTEILDAIGVPFCKGKVMASEPLWRHDEAGWRQTVQGWVRKAEGESLLNVDIFFDMQPVYGDSDLAEGLRRAALHQAAISPMFLRLLGADCERHKPPLNMFGNIKLEHGRVDLKKGGLLPFVSASRVVALATETEATSSLGRLDAAKAMGALSDTDHHALDLAQQRLLSAILRQQIVDIKAGLKPGTKVSMEVLERHERRELRESLHTLNMVDDIVRSVLMSDVLAKRSRSEAKAAA